MADLANNSICRIIPLKLIYFEGKPLSEENKIRLIKTFKKRNIQTEGDQIEIFDKNISEIFDIFGDRIK